jgi:hypothetical protein
MGVSYYTCADCGEAKSEHYGENIMNCKYCSEENWICYDCVDEDSDLRNWGEDSTDEDEEQEVCPVCEKEMTSEKIKEKKNKELDVLKKYLKRVLDAGVEGITKDEYDSSAKECFSDKINNIFKDVIKLIKK